MLKSISIPLNYVSIPHYEGEISMLPFDLNDLSNVPLEFKAIVESMVKNLPNRLGEAFLTVHGKFVQKCQTLRRGAPHIDGNYIKEVSSWGGGGGGNGWKVGGDGRTLSPEHHKISYENTTGGMLIVSNYSACKGWNGTYEGKANTGGDCSHIELGKGFMLEANRVYYGNSQFIHESLPLDRDIHRVMFRITLPVDYPALQTIN